MATKGCATNTSRPCAGQVGVCHYDCSEMNKVIRFRGWDAVDVFEQCNDFFKAMRDKNPAAEVPDCAIEYVEQNTDERFTHA